MGYPIPQVIRLRVPSFAPPPLSPSNNLPFNTAQEGEEPKKQQEPVPIYRNGWTAEQIDSKYSEYMNKFVFNSMLCCVGEDTFQKMKDGTAGTVIKIPCKIETFTDFYTGKPKTQYNIDLVCLTASGCQDEHLYRDTEGRRIFNFCELPEAQIKQSMPLVPHKRFNNLDNERKEAATYIAYLTTGKEVFGDNFEQYRIPFNKFQRPQVYEDAHKLFTQTRINATPAERV